jgi:hypothetical protein
MMVDVAEPDRGPTRLLGSEQTLGGQESCRNRNRTEERRSSIPLASRGAERRGTEAADIGYEEEMGRRQEGGKIPGRVGDSPIIGAGLYVDQEVGGAGSTGRGEENIRIAGAHTIVENMRHGMPPKEAVLDALKRIARNFGDDRERLSKIGINFYALRKDGEYAGGSLWNGAQRKPQFAVNDGGESRLEPCVHLLER